MQSIAIINNIPTPYRLALFSEIQRQILEEKKISFIFLSTKETVRNWNSLDFDQNEVMRVLPVIFQVRNKFTNTSDFIINRGFLRYVWFDRVVVFGYNYPTYILIAVLRRILGRSTILFCESTLHDKPRSVLKSFVKRVIFSCFSSVIVPGARSYAFAKSYACDGIPVLVAPNAVRKSRLANQFSSVASRTKVRLLYVGRLANEKNIDFILSSLAKADIDYEVVLVGAGPLETALRTRWLPSTNIIFKGFLEGDSLAQEYLDADVLVLASNSEPWGLVVNEAINYGLAILVSDQVGCSEDLVKENGQVFRVNDTEHFLSKLKIVCSNLSVYKLNSRELSKEVSIENQARIFVKAIDA